ncbi:hypothetical protein BD779DRAFT_1643693 [Infundibulicybe gibba]|nr:hypothetical protein BD779DRAFT_1643693 [Infundibulicybe gibba]
MSNSFSSLHAMREAKNAKSFVKETSGSSSDLPPDGPSQTPGEAPTGVPSSVPIPPRLEAYTDQKSGRALRSRSHQKPGDVLIKTNPHIVVLSTAYLDTHCSSCFAPAPQAGLKRCTQCRVIYYCDPKCQSQDWALHKSECTALQAWAATAPSEDLSIPSDAVRSLGRILWRKQKRGIDSDWAKEIDSMQSHRASLHPSTYELHAHLSYSLVRYLSLSSPDQLKLFGLESTGDLVDLISRFTTNTFTLTTPTLTPIGSSISPLIALINHSCIPNAAVVFPGKPASGSVMQVTALREILPGEEIVTSYIDTTVSRLQRRKILQETYNFTCECNLCTAEGDAQDLREAIWCPKSCGGTCLMPTQDSPSVVCTRCDGTLEPSQSEAVLDALRLGREGLEKATTLQTSDPQKALKLTTHLTPFLLSAGLTPASHPLLALSRLHQSFLIDSLSLLVTTKSIPKEGNGAKEAQDILDEAIRTAVRNVAGLEGILPMGHPIRELHVRKPGVSWPWMSSQNINPKRGTECSIPAQRVSEATTGVGCSHKARDELLVGFGKVNEGGNAGREVRDQIAKLERELKYWNMGARAALADIQQAHMN